MKTTTTTAIFLSALISATMATPLAPLQSRYSHIQLIQRATPSNGTAPSTTAAGSTLTIQEGDTLASIAATAGVGICDIAKANGITDPNVIEAGASLTIPTATGEKDDTSCLSTGPA